MDGEDRYLSLAQLAAYSGLSVKTLSRCLVATPAPLPHFKVANRILVRRSDFDRWIEQVGTPEHVTRARSLADKVRQAVDGIRGTR